jgi:hypothetical protein
MLRWLRGKRTSEAPVEQRTPAADGVRWRADTSLPIPDWERQPWPQTEDSAVLHAHANGLAAAWLDATATALVAHAYRRDESHNFMVLSALDARPAQVLLDYLERSRRRVLATLDGIAKDDGHGKQVAMVFADEPTYYGYIENYGTDSQEPEAFSGGMFIDHGYGHFVFPQGPFESMEALVVHELTHCLVRHLAIPAWLNEGLAVNTEHRFVPPRRRYRPEELKYLFARFWNEQTIQEFWSGKSFLRPDDGQPLSYELARLLVHLLDKDYALLARFCADADGADGGDAAAQRVFGAGLQELAGIVLGPGQWRPQPESWRTGTEKGQFRFTPNP